MEKRPMSGQVIRNAAIVVLFSTVVASAGGIVWRSSHLRFSGKYLGYQSKSKIPPRATSKTSFGQAWVSKQSWSGARNHGTRDLLGRCCLGQKYDLVRMAQNAYQHPPVKQKLQNLWGRLPKNHKLHNLVGYKGYKPHFPHHHLPKWPWHPHKPVSPCHL
jgi:hypothetical protein